MYAKIFAQIYDGTLCTHGPWEALVTFQQLLILADQEGHVDMTASAITRRTTIPVEIIEKGITALMLPDPESRTPVEEGKRIVLLSEGRPWGWRIVNYAKYRQLQREADRRDYHREYWHKRQEKVPDGAKTRIRSTDSTVTQQTQHTQPAQPIAYAEANAEAEKQPGAGAPLSPAKPVTTPKPAVAKPETPADQATGVPLKQLVGLCAMTCPTLPKTRFELFRESAGGEAMRQRWKWLLSKEAVREDNTRYATTPAEAVAWFKAFFENVDRSDFLSGRSGTWKADLGWLMKRENFMKVVQGNYVNKAVAE